MKAWKIGFWVLALGLFSACSVESGGGQKDTTNESSSAGDSEGDNDGAAEPSDADGSEGDGATADGTDADGTERDGGGADGTMSGACTNDGDMAVLAGVSFASLACEGAACTGKHLTDEDAQEMCVDEDAPTLSKLSAACRACFKEIVACAPNKCVRFPGLFNGSGECPVSAPNTDFGKCRNPATPDAKCAACQKRECQPAFAECSGLTN